MNNTHLFRANLIQSYEGSLSSVSENECTDEDEFSEIQDDRLYLNRLLSLVNLQIDELENSMPSLNPVRDKD
ncbi:hypothetical protein [Alkalimarinus alittae]|uniref:Uncharacterized protein n=1 Tax=Alkalimarinus alittae TaxID=2961619 RepID=A0ABY6N7J4_9ALTE|nr:hypothetical protein [Alkalimarinus alittae]UZE98093.1 hypothetical protein NKI27_06015 [Alkalimarinus alittae]